MAVESFSLRRIAVPAFGPSVLWAVGSGAVTPVVALSARDLGASVSLAAIFAGLGAAAEFVTIVPAGQLVARLGEKRALVLAAAVDALAGLVCWLAPNLVVLGIGLLLMGPAGAVFLLARQSYLTAAAPVGMRARAMSTLGGVTRIGWLIGPFLGAALVDRWGTATAYAVPAVVGLLGMALAAWSMDLGIHEDLEPGAGGPRVRTLDVMRSHRRVLATVGVGVLAISLGRYGRAVALPLWGEAIGLSAAQVSVIFGLGMALEVLLFYPAGSLMDRWGRVVVALPTALLLGVGLVVLPWTSSVAGVTAVALLTSVGNGLGSGIVMTLGADAAPVRGRAQFLSAWRLLSLVGGNGAPLVLAALSATVGLGPAILVVGVVTLLGGGWLLRWLPEYDPRRADGIPGSGRRS